MAITVAGQGVAAYNVFVLAAVARLADIVLTDGTTRTSVNATFQMVPVADRLAVQAFVEGVGVPVAIGVTGAVLLLINLGGLGAGAVIVFGVLVSVVWTVSGAGMYRSYRRALANEMRREPVLATSVAIDQNDAALQALLRSEDAREVRLGLDLLPRNVSPTSRTDVPDHPDPGTRMLTLGRFAASGDATTAKAVAELVAELAHSPDPIDRRAAALGLVGANNDRDRSILLGLLEDGETTVRSAALDAVTPEDAVEADLIRTVVAAAEDPYTRRSATAALRRLGEPAIPFVAAAIASEGAHRRASLVRAAAALAADHGLPAIKPALDDPDRVVVLTALQALDAAGGHKVPLSFVLDGLFEDAAAHAALSLAARSEFAALDGSLTRALDDEVDLARQLMIAVLALRHGAGVHDAVRVIERTDGQRRALGVEALDVLISREEAASTLPLIRRDLTPDEMTAALWRSQLPVRRREDWLADMTDDPDSVWRSSWLARCAAKPKPPEISHPL